MGNHCTKFIFFSSAFILLAVGLFFPLNVFAATFYLLPSSLDVAESGSFLLEARISAEEEINAVDMQLIYPGDLAEVVDLSQGGSIIDVWVENPKVDKTSTTIRFIGGITGGFKGDGLIGKIVLRAKKSGKFTLGLSEKSQVFLNDGKGTRDSLRFLDGSYEILPKPADFIKISSGQCPEEEKWCPWPTLRLAWQTKPGAEYSYVLSHDAQAQPDDTADTPVGGLVFYELEDGIYYFRLKEKTGGKWGPVFTFQQMIDTVAPEPFNLAITKIENNNYLIFSATDKLSGVDFYEVKEGNRDFVRAQNPYLLADQTLQGIIKVRAADKAGNERFAEYTPPKISITRGASWVMIAGILGAIIILSAIIYLVIRKLRCSSKKNKQIKK